jgi:hypothetical protein
MKVSQVWIGQAQRDLGQQQVARRRDRYEFGQTLDQAQDDRA